jgi:aminomethyltransferase
LEIKKLALYDVHKRAGAKIVEFAGFWMPIQYEGILNEHRKVRNSVGLFDVSHMGEFIVKGRNAVEFLQSVTINDVSKLAEFQVQYSALCYENAGIVDDLLIYRFPDYFLVVVNASNIEKDFDWMQKNLMPGVDFKNLSAEYALLAIQGRNSMPTLQKLTNVHLNEIPYYSLANGEVAGVKCYISRTGYTGELGYEIGFPPEYAEKIWMALMDAGREFNIAPIGLAARDTLRLEMKYCLYGNDIDATTNPLEAGLGWITKLKKDNFVGREALLRVKEQGIPRKLVGIVLEQNGVPRHGYPIYKNGARIGEVTSGTMSPMLQQGIAMGYVKTEYSEIGCQVEIEIRGKHLPARVVETPFYKIPY